MGSKTGHKLGNMATVKVDDARVAEPDSVAQSATEFGDKDQLARMGKKQVLRVRCGQLPISLGQPLTLWQAQLWFHVYPRV